MKLAILLTALCGALAARAEILDRVAVAVGNKVITTRDIGRQARLSAFLSGEKPDLSPEGRRKTAEAMVDQLLVSRELETARYPEPDASELEEAFSDFKSEYFSNEAAYGAALKDYGVTEGEVKQQLLWQRRLLSFIGVRFRPAAQVSENEIRDYFEKSVLPAAKAANPGASYSLEEFHDQIVTKLTGDRVDQEVARWLAEARSRTVVVFHEGAFQ